MRLSNEVVHGPRGQYRTYCFPEHMDQDRIDKLLGVASQGKSGSSYYIENTNSDYTYYDTNVVVCFDQSHIIIGKSYKRQDGVSEVFKDIKEFSIDETRLTDVESIGRVLFTPFLVPEEIKSLDGLDEHFCMGRQFGAFDYDSEYDDSKKVAQYILYRCLISSVSSKDLVTIIVPKETQDHENYCLKSIVSFFACIPESLRDLDFSFSSTPTIGEVKIRFISENESDHSCIRMKQYDGFSVDANDLQYFGVLESLFDNYDFLRYVESFFDRFQKRSVLSKAALCNLGRVYNWQFIDQVDRSVIVEWESFIEHYNDQLNSVAFQAMLRSLWEKGVLNDSIYINLNSLRHEPSSTENYLGYYDCIYVIRSLTAIGMNFPGNNVDDWIRSALNGMNSNQINVYLERIKEEQNEKNFVSCFGRNLYDRLVRVVADTCKTVKRQEDADERRRIEEERRDRKKKAKNTYEQASNETEKIKIEKEEIERGISSFYEMKKGIPEQYEQLERRISKYNEGLHDLEQLQDHAEREMEAADLFCERLSRPKRIQSMKERDGSFEKDDLLPTDSTVKQNYRLKTPEKESRSIPPIEALKADSTIVDESSSEVGRSVPPELPPYDDGKKKRWNIIIAAGVFVIGIISGFLVRGLLTGKDTSEESTSTGKTVADATETLISTQVITDLITEEITESTENTESTELTDTTELTTESTERKQEEKDSLIFMYSDNLERAKAAADLWGLDDFEKAKAAFDDAFDSLDNNKKIHLLYYAIYDPMILLKTDNENYSENDQDQITVYREALIEYAICELLTGTEEDDNNIEIDKLKSYEFYISEKDSSFALVQDTYDGMEMDLSEIYEFVLEYESDKNQIKKVHFVLDRVDVSPDEYAMVKSEKEDITFNDKHCFTASDKIITHLQDHWTDIQKAFSDKSGDDNEQQSNNPEETHGNTSSSGTGGNGDPKTASGNQSGQDRTGKNGKSNNNPH